MSSTSLQIGISGVNAARRAMEVISEVTSPTSTPTGTRAVRGQVVMGRLAPMPSEVPREIEAGVKITGVTRLRDGVSDNAYRSQAAGVSGAELRAEIAARAEEVMGPLDSGVQDALGAFWASWSACRPPRRTSPPARRCSPAVSAWPPRCGPRPQQVHALSDLVVGRGGDVVRQINTYSDQLAKLNSQIGDAVFRGAAPNDLLDQR